jgi:hypothetical protein
MIKIIIMIFIFSSSAISANSLMFQPRMGNKYYVNSVLENIYGPESKIILQKALLPYSDFFGGPCDPYEVVLSKKKGSSGTLYKCFNGMPDLRSHMISQPSTLRTMQMKNLCQKLSQDQKTLKFSLKVLNNVKEFKDKIQSYYHSFYPWDNLSNSEIENIIKTLNKKYFWKTYSELLCQSERWQIP